MLNVYFGGISMCEDSKNKPITEYFETKIGKTTYRVTAVYLGKIDLERTLEELMVRKILAAESNNS